MILFCLIQFVGKIFLKMFCSCPLSILSLPYWFLLVDLRSWVLFLNCTRCFSSHAGCHWKISKQVYDDKFYPKTSCKFDPQWFLELRIIMKKMKNMQKQTKNYWVGVHWRKFSTNLHSSQNNLFSFLVTTSSIGFSVF